MIAVVGHYRDKEILSTFFNSKYRENMDLTHVASLTQKVQLETTCKMLKS